MCTKAEVDWTKVDSDHAGVQIWLDICKKAPSGPGLFKANGSLLEDPIKLMPKPSHGGFGQFFPTGTYKGIGTSVSSLKHVMKSTTTTKKTFIMTTGSMNLQCTF